MGARFDLADIQNLPEWARKQIAAKMDEQRDRDISKLATMIENSHGNQKSATQEQKQELAKESKYRARKTQRTMPNGRIFTFDSKGEAKRYDELALLLKAGKIDDLRLQENFTLQEAYTTAEGDRVRAIIYTADFTYWELDEKGSRTVRVVEDFKSNPTRTKTYLMKRKMLRDRFGIAIREVSAN